jgi:L,D-transpeptidase YcbB
MVYKKLVYKKLLAPNYTLAGFFAASLVLSAPLFAQPSSNQIFAPLVMAPQIAPPAAPIIATPPIEAVPVPTVAGETTAQPVPTIAARPKPKKAKPVNIARQHPVIKDDPRPSFTPDTFIATAEAASRYLDIVERGGWPTVSGSLSLGSKGVQVIALRKRLASEGDLAEAEGAIFDKTVQDAVKQFQYRHGLIKNGVVSDLTLKELNVSAKTRFQQLNESARRMAARNFDFGSRYVVANIASASIEAIEGESVVRRYVAVVGKPDLPSPEVTARIGTVNFNPTWTVPTSIIKNEIIPKMQKNPNYLSALNIRILDKSGEEVSARSIDWKSSKAVNYTLRQDSSKTNALGQIRIDMPNKHSVYMHDTPSKRFFNADFRFLSHGCVRVDGVRDLANWLLEPNGGWDRSRVDSAIDEGERKDVRLAKPVNVAWVYMTGFVTKDGLVNFREDVYGLDVVTKMAAN